MAGTKAGGEKAARMNKELYGKDFYREIGRKGGKFCGCKGFAANRELARIAGAKGGRISKRGLSKKRKTIDYKTTYMKKMESKFSYWTVADGLALVNNEN